MRCPTTSLLAAVALLAATAAAGAAQERAADSIPPEPEYDWPEFRLVAPGDTLVVPDSAEHGVFVLTRREREVEEIRRRRDAIRLELLRADTASLRAQRDDYREAADTLRSALSLCRAAKSELETVVDLKNDAIESLRPGPIERLVDGPVGDALKIGGSFWLGRESCGG